MYTHGNAVAEARLALSRPLPLSRPGLSLLGSVAPAYKQAELPGHTVGLQFVLHKLQTASRKEQEFPSLIGCVLVW